MWRKQRNSRNMRSSGTDDSVRITPKIQMTLEECMEYIQQDECIEVTPQNIRLRKYNSTKKTGRSLQR